MANSITRRRSAAPGLAGATGLLAVTVVGNAAGARDVLAQALRAASEREGHQRSLEQARFGRALASAHDDLAAVDPALRQLIASGGPGPWEAPAKAALRQLERIGDQLRASRPLRDALADEQGRLPVFGGHAAHVPSRKARPLKRYGDLSAVPTELPERLRRAVRQVGLVLDEVRLLHTADIERSVFVFTLVARAGLVSLTPMLSSWSFVRIDWSPQIIAVWGVAATISLATALRATEIVDLAMEDTTAGVRHRRRLLVLEVPVAVAGLLFAPAWTVAVFVSGWTNWWQRQTPGLEFDWRKLAAFVVAVASLQQAGLHLAGLPTGEAVAETALTMAAVLVTGSSYGAMLPLAFATGVGVIFGDSRRSLSAARRARDELLRCARELEVTAAAIVAAAPEAPVTAQAAATARQAARQLERSADRLGRRGLLASHVLVDLADEAVVRSYLPRWRTVELDRAQAAAAEASEPPPAYAGEPLFEPPDLRVTRLREQRIARRLRLLLEHALNEGHRHGTGGVRVLIERHGDRLVLQVANRPRSATSTGLAQEGSQALKKLAEDLPDGRLERAQEVVPEEVGIPAGPPWWVIEVSWSVSTLEDHT